jgi:hypothetical protein
MSGTGCDRCPLALGVGYCWSNAGCPVTIRAINGPRSKWEKEAPNCIYLKRGPAPWCKIGDREGEQLLLDLT